MTKDVKFVSIAKTENFYSSTWFSQSKFKNISAMLYLQMAQKARNQNILIQNILN